ncbi:MAG: TIGR04283 family arsenosugar biosynthesis glycosyltransferase [Thermodesulfovibrionales bacterium]
MSTEEKDIKSPSDVSISVIMPVLNEEKNLRKTLTALRISANEELIVVDGGSTDATVALAQDFTEKVFATRKGRGHQMNHGAGMAGGDILLFLHADCLLPPQGFDLIREALRDRSVAAGAFDLRIDHPARHFRLIEAVANLRSRFTSIPYGDQGLFIRASLFRELGGFADLPLMEDIEISRRIKKTGRVIFLRPPVLTSPRRWLKEGPVYTTLRDWTIAVAYRFLNMSPHRFMRYYRDVR